MVINLFNDQNRLVNKARASIGGGCKRLLIQAATGCGKSVMGTYMIQQANLRGNSCAFVVPRRELLSQMAETWYKFGVNYSYVASGQFFDPKSENHICSMQTLIKRPEVINPKILFIDETHYATTQLKRIAEYYAERGTIIIGLSATPWRMNGKGLGDIYSDMVEGETVRWLIDNKRLSQYEMFGVSSPDFSGIKTSNGEYQKKQMDERMEQDRVLIGDAVGHYKKHANGKLNVVFCQSIKHSKITAQAFKDAGIPAAHMDAETPSHVRSQMIQDYADRKLHVLTNVDLMCFGFDLASQVGRDVTVECMSDLRPTQSLALQMQKWGRVLRYKDYPALIFDHANNFKKHGAPCWDRDWTLADRNRKQRKEAEEEADEKQRQCEFCFHIHEPAPKCPKCGFVYPVRERKIEEVDGDLEKIEIKQRRRREEYMCETLEDWEGLAKERGHKSGWAKIRHGQRVKNEAEKLAAKLNRPQGDLFG